MKKFYLIYLIFITLSANAQQMVVPSSFDENRMIVKKMDKDGNFVPVEENTLTETSVTQPAVQTKQTTFSQKKSVEKKKVTANRKAKEEEKKGPPKKKFRKIERDYSIPKSTFGNDPYDTGLPSTFSNGTMERAQEDLNKERYSFQECASDDKDCQEYDFDSKGNIISR